MTNHIPTPLQIVHYMLNNDPFSQWMGIKIVELIEGKAILQIKIKKEMLNGFNIVHGGIYYSLADSALAFASNTYGFMCKSIETSISHLKSCKKDDLLIATTIEKYRGNKIAIYEVEIKNQNQELVALFKGNVYILSKKWNTIMNK